MLHRVNAVGTIDPKREMHYRFHQKIDLSIYPQVHDFYEIMLTTEGTMEMEINGEKKTLSSGALFLIRPGDIHSRKAIGKCSFINLAFPTDVIVEMFHYLDIPEMQEKISLGEFPPNAILSPGETLILKARLETLNLLPVEQPHRASMELRYMILDLMMHYFLSTFSTPAQMSCPNWLSALLDKMENPELFSFTLDEFASMAGRTKEHLCRSFQKYLGVSPSAYLNAKRLNYAANLLLHSDQKVIDIAYASGFQSLSRFYHAFKIEFNVSPLEYRKDH